MSTRNDQSHEARLGRRFVSDLLACLEQAPGGKDRLVPPAREAAARFLAVSDPATGDNSMRRAAGHIWLSQAICHALRLTRTVPGRSEIDALLQTIEQIDPLLTWVEGYSPEEVGEGFLDHFTFTTIVGPGALVESHDIAAGITLMGPELFYPWHAHPAAEIYLCLSTGTHWGLDHGEPEPVPFGQVVCHPGASPHAMRTTAEPLLAPWIWYGDVAKPASMV